MILLLTTEAGDFSHVELIHWLEYYKANYIVLSGESLLSGSTHFTVKSDAVMLNDLNIKDTVNVVYSRRWMYPTEIKLVQDSVLNDSLISNLYREVCEIKLFIDVSLENVDS